MSLNVRLKDVCEARVDGSGEWVERGSWHVQGHGHVG